MELACILIIPLDVNILPARFLIYVMPEKIISVCSNEHTL